ncbi:MAG: DUF3800 domain-containing protein [Clostridia bacterium]|nr:DUF3800 domain-containing protein [Clostridia bacterium]
MDIFVYSDESGVFDYKHNKYFVFAGVVFLSKTEKDKYTRLYTKAEKDIRTSESIAKETEVKATGISNKNKGKLFRSLNKAYKFGVVIEQKRILQKIYADKKSKQRYLDYAYKIAIKRFFEKVISDGIINPSEVENIRFFIDEHSTATNGRYELREALEQELKWGTFNYSWNTFYPPVFPKVKSVTVDFCDSASKTLVRAADIVANKLYYKANSGQKSSLDSNFIITYLP